MKQLNYEKVFWTLVNETKKYLLDNNLKAMVLGISGGIDSTITAAICHEVSKQTGIPLIGRSLPIKNKNDEFDTSKLVGEAFCSKFRVKNLSYSYKAVLIDCLAHNDKEVEQLSEWGLTELEEERGHRKIANGNLQARCRMQYLYDVASQYDGLVMSTDNQTEYQLGFWTLHGDVGDFDPLHDLWKTEVYELANQILKNYLFQMTSAEEAHMWDVCETYNKMFEAVKKSMELTPTDGLGISSSDLDQIGAKSYTEVDAILQDFLAYNELFSATTKIANADRYLEYNALYDIEPEVIKKVLDRHIASEFKRKEAPIYIERKKYA